ncbi:uncharacterized protein LOC120768896 [Bactrocera tryoni]|uniref:uncharacterized protein LOC120768896 n=1 Tax=Bactrocera tryoni TaxID=59916 RepID=UPI001A957A81|nr:uncharacterized protein LOC120768896 [Bactrocera tryoni]
MFQWHRHFSKVLTLLLGCACLSQQLAHPQGYAQVQHSGRDGANNEGPKIFKALNMDLIYPRTFNTSDNVVSTTETAIRPSEPTAQSQQRLAPTYVQGAQEYAAEQPILYVTPPAADLKVDGSNIEINSPHTEAATIMHANHNPVFTVDNEQQQSEAYDMPAGSTLAEPSPALQEYASTGRAIDYNRPTYNFNQLMTPLIKSPPLPAPAIREKPVTSNIGKIIYPQAFNQRRPPNEAEINKLSGKAPFSDRFTPGEATAAGQFKQHKHNHAQSFNAGNSNKLAAASQIVQQTYKAPENIYTFPPNINSHYSSPYQDPKAALPSSNVNSYAAAPSGPLPLNVNLATASSNDSGYKYPGPTNPDNLPPAGKDADDAKAPAADADSDDTIGVLPASAMGDGDKDVSGKDNAGGDDMGANDHDHDHDQDHPPPVDDTEYPTPPPGWVEQQPDEAPIHSFSHDSYHDHSFGVHDHFPSYPHYYPHYPEIIYDDHHHHHHDHPPPPTLPPITTEMPPPEPPPEPRVKKYSYFYIGRKLWYIPLYFTVWFSFYVLWLILKSIARHKVNLPNHYVSKRSLPDFVARETQAKEYINELTVSVLEKIEKFQRNYLT